MYVAHGATPPAAAHGSALAAVLCLLLLALAPAVLALRTWREERRGLRACPLCAAAAVRRWAYEDLGSGRVRIDVQCGQCGVWRRTVAPDAHLERHERAVKRDRRRMADDCLARTRARPAPQRGRRA